MSLATATSGRPSRVRAPRCYLSVEGSTFAVEQSTLTRKSTQNADGFTAAFDLGSAAKAGLPLAMWADWDQSKDVSLIYSTAPGEADRATMFTGTIDRPEIKLPANTISVRGRDKSSKLMENRRNTKFANQKSSEIVEQIAKDAGLTPHVIDSGTFAGKSYTADNIAHLVQNRTDYETLSLLAEREGFRWYVEGSDLYFEPKTSDTDVYPIYYYPPGGQATYAVGNILDLTLNRNTHAGRPTTVTYAGWHHGRKKLFKATASAGGVGDPIVHRFHHNGNLQDQLEKKAQAKLKDIVRHELGIIAVLPGDLSVDPRMQVSLTGTETIFDQTFDIDSIDYSMGWEQAFTMTIDAKGAKQGRGGDG